LIVGSARTWPRSSASAACSTRHGERFLKRVLTPEERARYERVTRGAPGHLAKRWAAKEAFSKAIGTGIHPPFTLAIDCRVARAERGTRARAQRRHGAAPARPRGQALASLAHRRRGVAVAFVVLEG
jgi:holo-[acyl-carrier protein] synthase